MADNVKINPLSSRTFELLQLDTLESQFPVVFADGGGFPLITAYCAQCNRPIENQHLRGRVIRTRSDMVTLEAAGACFHCKIATPVYYRLHQDGTMTGISPKTGKWTEWNARPGFFRGIMHTLFPAFF
jgi:hypothetical protein